MYGISGTITQNGAAFQDVEVVCYTRTYPRVLISRQFTNASGFYQFSGLVNGTEYTVIAFDPTGGTSFNAQVLDKMTPVVMSPVDTHWESVQALLLNDAAASGSVTFFDESTTVKKTVTKSGDAAYSSTNPPTGLATAGAFDGTGDYIDIDAAAGNNLAFNGDYTLEGYFRYNTLTGTQVLMDMRPTGGSQLNPLLYSNGTNLLFHCLNATRITGSLPTVSTWAHIAVARSGSSTKLFLDGVQTGSTWTDSTSLAASDLRIAQAGDGSSTGNFRAAGIRVTKGAARYTANFTSPTLPLTRN